MRDMNTEDTFRYIFDKGRFTFSFKNLCDCFSMCRALGRPFKFKLYGSLKLCGVYRAGWDILGYERGLGKVRFDDFFEVLAPTGYDKLPEPNAVKDIYK